MIPRYDKNVTNIGKMAMNPIYEEGTIRKIKRL